jgi:hypothetical protein
MPRGVYSRKAVAPSNVPAPSQEVATVLPLVAPSFYRNQRVNVDTIDNDALKEYARTIGITQRDVDGLSENRLRQNCKARILESMED